MASNDLLFRAYSPEAFQSQADEVMALITKQLKKAQTEDVPHTIPWQSPEDSLRF